MQATYNLRRSSAGILTAVMVFLAALVLGGAGGYLIKSAAGISVTTTTVRATNPHAIAPPVNTQTTTDTSGAGRRHFPLPN
jgi:hypothetical protein